MKLSEEAKQYADFAFQTEMESLNIEHNEILNNLIPDIGRVVWTERKLRDYCVQWIQKVVNAWISAYLKAYEQFNEDLTKDEVEEIKSQVNNLITEEYTRFRENSIVANALTLYRTEIQLQFDRILKAATNRLLLVIEERAFKKPATPLNNSINIQGHNYGPIQQGGQGNTQNVATNTEFLARTNELLTLIETSSLTAVQKLRATHDIKAVQSLSTIESNPEVTEEAQARIESITAVISLSADLVSLGIPIIQIVRAFFGI